MSYGFSATRGVLAICFVSLLAFSVPSVWAMNAQMEAQAMQLESQQDWRGLAALANRATAENPTDGEAWFYAGAAQQGLGNYAAAMAALKKAERFGSPALKAMAQAMIAPGRAPVLPPRTAPQDSASPEFSPATMASMTAQAKRSWHSDAIPVGVIVMKGNPYMVTVNYYSPSTHTGLMMISGLNGLTMQPVASPNWSTVALPQDFKSLNAAIAEARKKGLTGSLDRASLWRTGDATGLAGLVWDLSFGYQDNPAQIVASVVSGSDFNQLLASAQRGDKAAQYNLALAYAFGTGIPEDPIKSFEWMQRSATQGNPAAANKLGQFFSEGYGTAKNPQEAAYWYGQGAKTGYAPAEYNLGLAYEKGDGVAKNMTAAEQWISLAAQQGNDAARDELGVIRLSRLRLSQGPTAEQNYDAIADRVARDKCDSIPFGMPVEGGNGADAHSPKYPPILYENDNGFISCVFPEYEIFGGWVPALFDTKDEMHQEYGLPLTYNYYHCQRVDSVLHYHMVCSR